MAYKWVKGHEKGLVKKVDVEIRAGWRPLGGPISLGVRKGKKPVALFAQAMVDDGTGPSTTVSTPTKAPATKAAPKTRKSTTTTKKK